MVRAGEGVSAAQLGSSLRELTQRPGFEMLSAVRAGRAHGLWHNFYDAPTNILAIEAMAKSAARSIGSSLGREIIRGVLGTLLGGARRR